LAALSELARDLAAAAALGSQGTIIAVAADEVRHRASALLVALSEAAADGHEGEDSEEGRRLDDVAGTR
jgi:hypothetical protein